jgi:AraC-like DNA-binding protein
LCDYDFPAISNRSEFSRENFRTTPTGYRCLVLHVSDEAHRADINAQVAQRFKGNEVPLLIGLLRQLARRRDDGRDPVTIDTFVSPIIIDALALTWPADSSAKMRRPIDQRWHRIQQLVERRFSDPDFDLGSIAAEFGVTKRYVHLIFARMGDTPERYILKRRLDAAVLALCDPSPRNISEAALEAGFGDISHFCRTFRLRYGCTAREYRQRGRDRELLPGDA